MHHNHTMKRIFFQLVEYVILVIICYLHQDDIVMQHLKVFMYFPYPLVISKFAIGRLTQNLCSHWSRFIQPFLLSFRVGEVIFTNSNADYTMTTQMVDIYLLSFYLLATYQPFASSQYVLDTGKWILDEIVKPSQETLQTKTLTFLASVVD